MEITCAIPTISVASLYQYAKDFQTFAAALVAVLAAWITFYSAQRVARTQTRTAISTNEQQLNAAAIKEDRALMRQRLAFLIMTHNRAHHAGNYVGLALNGLRTIEKQVLSGTPPSIDTWKVFHNNRVAGAQLIAYSGKWEELAALDASEQTLFHNLEFEIWRFQTILALLSAEDVPNAATLPSLVSALETIHIAVQKLSKAIGDRVFDLLTSQASAPGN